MADEKAAAPKKKAAGKVRPSIKKGSFYKDGKKTADFCPKCGPGIFMAKHKDRQTCGKCGYTEFTKKE